jgi:AcrR family transcriptional regulator
MAKRASTSARRQGRRTKRRPAPASAAAGTRGAASTSTSTSTSAPGPLAGKRETQSAARREAILAAALDEFSARGYEAARLADVAKRAGVAKGTIYLYFRDKESLFQELIRTALAPIAGILEGMGAIDLPLPQLSERIVDMFVRDVYETRRKDVIRLVLSEGRRFPQLAEFYYREVLSRIIAAVRALLRRAAARGEVPAGLVDFPQLIAAPGLIAVIWDGLFDRFEPLDLRAMMKTHVDLLFGSRRAT